MEVLSSAELRGDRYYEIISSLRVALTNNTVTLVAFRFCFDLKFVQCIFQQLKK